MNVPRPCPACHSREFRKWGEKNGFSVLGCSICDTLFTDHVPDESEQQNYDEYYGESNLSVPAFIRERVKEIVSGFAQLRQTNNFLDIGFGAGTVLEVAEEQSWRPHGLEVSLPAVEQARSRGFEVFHGNLTDANYPDSFFDVVTASEILEHLREPEVELREIWRILRPGGLLWGTTPSAKSLSFKLLGLNWTVLSPPEHIQLYSRSGAAMMMKKAGFIRVDFRTYGLNPSEIINHFRGGRTGIDEPFSRVASSYQLNESLTKSPMRKMFKAILNETLNAARMGDSLKIYAYK